MFTARPFVALAALLRISFVSPVCVTLMGPAHPANGRHAGKGRRLLEREPAAPAAPVDA